MHWRSSVFEFANPSLADIRECPIRKLLPEVAKPKIHIEIPDFERQSLKDNFHNMIFPLTIEKYSWLNTNNATLWHFSSGSC